MMPITTSSSTSVKAEDFGIAGSCDACGGWRRTSQIQSGDASGLGIALIICEGASGIPAPSPRLASITV
jgi:hypothetical protein